jgi:hypothetical protein
MSRIVIVIILYHRHKPIDFEYAIIANKNTFVITKLFLNLKCKAFVEALNLTHHFIRIIKIIIDCKTLWSSNSVSVTVVNETETNLVA